MRTPGRFNEFKGFELRFVLPKKYKVSGRKQSAIFQVYLNGTVTFNIYNEFEAFVLVNLY